MGAESALVVVPTAHMSWLVDAAKNAANKAEAALQKLDKEGGEVVSKAKQDLLAQNEGPAAVPAPPPRTFPKQAGSTNVVPMRVDPKVASTTSVVPKADTKLELKPLNDTKTMGEKNYARPVKHAPSRDTHSSDVDADAARVTRRRIRRVSLLDHVAALITQRKYETKALMREANDAQTKQAADTATTSKARDKAADEQDAAANTLRSLRSQRAAAQEGADNKIVELAGVGGERARQLAKEQRALTNATRIRDDAAHLVSIAERRIETSKLLGTKIESEDVDASGGTSAENDTAAHLSEMASLESSLRAAKSEVETVRRRLVDLESNEATRVSSPKRSDEDDELNRKLQRTTDSLLQEQQACENLKSDQAALTFRLESARAEIREKQKHETFESDIRIEKDDDAWSNDALNSDDDVEAYGGRGKDPNARSSANKHNPKDLAYVAASKVFGLRHEKLARDVSEAVAALDQFTLLGLHVWGEKRVARVAFFSYAMVMHLYVFALLWFGGSGPRATNTETIG